MSLKALPALVLLLGCTQATIKWGPDKEVSFYRVWTDVVISVEPDGRISYSSDPNDALQGQIIAALLAALQAKQATSSPSDQGDY